MQGFAGTSKQVAAKVSAINRDLNHIGGRLDWDIKSVSNINATIDQIEHEIDRYIKTLDKMSSFFNMAHLEYKKIDGQSLERLERFVGPSSAAKQNKGILSTILGWFGGLTLKTAKKFIAPAIMNLLPKGLMRNMGIVGFNLNKKSLQKIFINTMKKVLSYKHINIAKKGFWKNVGKAIKSNATKNVVKWPYAKEFKKAKQISILAKHAIKGKTGPKWYRTLKSQLKSAFTQSKNNVVKVIKGGIKGAAVIGALTEGGLGIYNGIKNNNTISQIVRGVGFDVIKGAAVGVAAMAAGAVVAAAVVAAAPIILPLAAIATGVVAVGSSIVAGAAITSVADYGLGSSDGSGVRFITNKNGEKVTLRDWATGDNDSAEKFNKESERVGNAVQVHIQSPSLPCPIY